MSVTTEAINRVERGADPEWIVRARQTVVAVAEEHETFTADEVWLAGLDRPREGRALGAVMRWATRNGVCVKTDRVRPSCMPDNHHKPQHIWQSLMCATEAEAAA